MNDKKFQCKRCGDMFARKDYLRAHLKRKIVCDPTIDDINVQDLLTEMSKNNTIPCMYCDKQFATIKTRNKHQMYSCENKPEPRTVINNYNTVINNYSIIIHTFGSENIEHVTSNKEFLERCLKTIQQDGMKNLIEKIHYCEDHPENCNVRVKSVRNDLFEVFKNNRWEIADKNETLDMMIRRGYRILHTFYHDDTNSAFKDSDMNDFDGKIFQLITKVGVKDPGVYFPLRKQIFAMVVNKRFVLMEAP